MHILHSGKHHVVVNKPANNVVVTGRGAPKPTLLDMVQEKYGKGMRPVHRLDRVTTGCCIFARDLYGQQALSNAFRRHLVDKRYLCIVEGEPTFTSLVIDARLERVDDPDARKGPLATQNISDEGQRALTRVNVWMKGNGFAIVEARPQTGRMHQIRAHLAHVGFPIVGDAHYGAKTEYAPHAIALHAFGVSFPAPEGGRAFVVAPLPEKFADVARKLGFDLTKKWSDESTKFGKQTAALKKPPLAPQKPRQAIAKPQPRRSRR